jgi:catechol 2,3-dioxygenase-like lactoylglutathione lyase family enzyme
MNATPHHVGCAVHRIEESRDAYAAAFGLVRSTRAIDVLSQHVKVSFVELAKGFYLELIAPLDDQAKLGSFLRVGFYHLCFLVDDLDATRERLQARRYVPLPVFRAEAFDGHRCQFLVSPQQHLVEIAEMTPPAFERFFEENLAPPV